MKRHLKSIITHKVSSNFLLIGLACAVQAINSIVLARYMDKDSFGQYGFLFNSIVPLVSSVVILGQNVSLVRLFSKQSLWSFNWAAYVKRTFLLFFIISAAATAAIGFYYDIPASWQTMLLISIFTSALLFITASIIRCDGRFNLSIIVERSAPAFFLPLMFAAFWMHKTNITSISAMKTLSYALPALLVCAMLFRRKPACDALPPVDRRVYTDGILLWGITLTLITINRIDSFFLAKLINYEAVATFCVLFTFSQLYDIASQAVWSVYSQKFSSPYKPNTRRFLVFLVAISAAVSLFYLAAGSPLLHLLFGGKYDSGLPLLLPFCIIGCLKIIYVYPSCHFIGKSGTRTLRRFFIYNLWGVAIKFLLTFTLIKTAGLMGCLLAGIVVWIFRNAVGYWLVYKEKQTYKTAQ